MNKALPIFFITLLLDMIGIGMIIPILPIIFTDPSSPAFLLTGYGEGAQYLIAGLITALAGLTTFIASPLVGELSDSPAHCSAARTVTCEYHSAYQ